MIAAPSSAPARTTRSAAHFLLLSAVLLVVALPRARAQQGDEQNLFRLAQSYEQGGKYEEALRYYGDLVHAHVMNAAYFDGLRRCLLQLKRYDTLIVLLDARIAMLPDETALLVQRGTARFLAGDEQRGDADWERAVAANPKDVEIYTHIADEAVNIRRYATAIAYLKRARRELDAPRVFVFELARAYTMGMHIDSAMQEYVGYLLDNPTALWQVQQQIAQFSDIPQAFAQALAVVRDACARHDENVYVRTLLAWMYMEQKRYDDAYGVYAEIDRLRHAGGAELVQFAHRAYEDGAYDAALRAFRALLDGDARGSLRMDAEFNEARCLEAIAGARDVPDALDPSAPPSDDAAAGSAAAFRDAAQRYDAVAAKYPDQPVGVESLYRLAIIKARRFGDLDGSLSLLERIAPLRRRLLGRADADIVIGDLLLEKGDARGALAQYRSALVLPALAPQQRDTVRFKLAQVDYYTGELDSAAAALEPLTKNSAADIANDALSLALFITQYAQPNDIPLKRYAAAEFLARRRAYSEAAAAMRDIVAAFPTLPIVDYAYLRQAEYTAATGKPRDAAAVYEEFLAKCPESILRDRALYALGTLYADELHDPVKAVDTYQTLLSTLPHSILAGKARERILSMRKGNS